MLLPFHSGTARAEHGDKPPRPPPTPPLELDFPPVPGFPDGFPRPAPVPLLAPTSLKALFPACSGRSEDKAALGRARIALIFLVEKHLKEGVLLGAKDERARKLLDTLVDKESFIVWTRPIPRPRNPRALQFRAALAEGDDILSMPRFYDEPTAERLDGNEGRDPGDPIFHRLHLHRDFDSRFLEEPENYASLLGLRRLKDVDGIPTELRSWLNRNPLGMRLAKELCEDSLLDLLKGVEKSREEMNEKLFKQTQDLHRQLQKIQNESMPLPPQFGNGSFGGRGAPPLRYDPPRRQRGGLGGGGRGGGDSSPRELRVHDPLRLGLLPPEAMRTPAEIDEAVERVRELVANDAVRLQHYEPYLSELQRRRAEPMLYIPIFGAELFADLTPEKSEKVGRALANLNARTLHGGMAAISGLFDVLPKEKLEKLLKSDAFAKLTGHKSNLTLLRAEFIRRHDPQGRIEGLDVLAREYFRGGPAQYSGFPEATKLSPFLARRWLGERFPSLLKEEILPLEGIARTTVALLNSRNDVTRSSKEDELLARLPPAVVQSDLFEKNALALSPDQMKWLKLRYGNFRRNLHLADFRARLKSEGIELIAVPDELVDSLRVALGREWKDDVGFTVQPPVPPKETPWRQPKDLTAGVAGYARKADLLKAISKPSVSLQIPPSAFEATLRSSEQTVAEKPK